VTSHIQLSLSRMNDDARYPLELGRPVKRVAVASVIMAAVGWVVGVIGVALLFLSHMFTSGCVVDQPTQDAGFLSLLAGALLGFGATLVGIIALTGPGRVHGGRLPVLGVVLGGLALLICAYLAFSTLTPHAVSPKYLHSC
jgi:hypothetical protein